MFRGVYDQNSGHRGESNIAADRLVMCYTSGEGLTKPCYVLHGMGGGGLNTALDSLAMCCTLGNSNTARLSYTANLT